MNQTHIETSINTAAIAATTAGMTFLMQKEWWGFLIIGVGFCLEFGKYWGRKKRLWK